MIGVLAYEIDLNSCCVQTTGCKIHSNTFVFCIVFNQPQQKEYGKRKQKQHHQVRPNTRILGWSEQTMYSCEQIIHHSIIHHSNIHHSNQLWGTHVWKFKFETMCYLFWRIYSIYIIQSQFNVFIQNKKIKNDPTSVK